MDAPSDNAITPVHGIRTGIGGWTYAPWRDNFYPKGLVQRRELEYASRKLAAIEINGTYYRAQKPSTYATWRDQTPQGFVFSAKAPMRIVMSRTLAKTGAQVEDFVGGIAELGDRLGPLVWQFEHGTPRDRDDFAAFLALLPRKAGGRTLRHVLDVRDPGFVDAGYIALAREHGMATVFTDSDEHPSFADVTSGFVYARLMRSRAELATGYPRAELVRWAARARESAAGGEPDDLPRIGPASATAARRDVFVFFIGAAKERNPAAAMALHALLATTP
ncbi:DUF72 domain-containing protein [Luteimonas sp. MC1825]|uniref:DUF72 domain-containing protein n=1 Tax=Luteimonas sp. MC1825 TaxID=2761107 RepID=UPI00161B558E|nr:DUF72 domain-containing protein [Luteimonas sp. MC1825]MBB6598733.1 DUF72 domain-containing protein [Luteimonas sp. MC1825]QOC88898.1 DUF72 domain-containing protein [Luteimonas sp. MC1825]